MDISRWFLSLKALLLALFIALQASGLIAADVKTDSAKIPVISATAREDNFRSDTVTFGAYALAGGHQTDEQVRAISEAGIDFVYMGADETALTNCDKYGVGVIADGLTTSDGINLYASSDASSSPVMNLTSSSLTSRHSCLWGINIIDEPAADRFKDLNSIVDHFYANTTGLLPYINLFPDCANSQQLAETPAVSEPARFLLGWFDNMNDSYVDFANYINEYAGTIDTDYICYDHYPLETNRTATTWIRGLDIASEQCRASGRDLWIVVQAAGNVEDGGGCRHNDETDIRWQDYVSLSFGARTIIYGCYDGGWWDEDSHIVMNDGTKNQLYYDVQKVNAEVRSFADIYGQYQPQGAYLVNKYLAEGICDQRYLTPVDSDLKPSVTSTSPILIGVFKDKDGKMAYTFVNMTDPLKNKTITASVSFSGSDVKVYGSAGGTVSGGKLRLTLPAGAGVFVTVG